MVTLIPAVKDLKLENGFLQNRAISFDSSNYSARLCKALEKLPVSNKGAQLSMDIASGEGEGYTLDITADSIHITAECEAAAFYAIQTLRQIFKEEKIPCLSIKDRPDFKYRGFYQDISRGKIATVETLKKLIDMMAYYKMNALQLYVEHIYEFEGCEELHKETSFITGAELRELDAYCRDNFIDFQPSLATFGHMFDLLDLKQYRHLRVLKDYENDICRWADRHKHHTIDPSQEESFEVVSSLIDQFAPNFTSDYFNICCDETFDLKTSYPKELEVKLYIDFVKKITSYLKAKGKKIMMWADVLLEYPEFITELPEDTIFLNWMYRANPEEDKVAIFGSLGRKQIVCSGTSSWWRFCESVDCEESNIIMLAEHGYKHGAIGMLTTNWGDWGNLASIDNALYGLVLGAAKSWDISTKVTDEFRADVNALLYHCKNGLSYMRAIGEVHNKINWCNIANAAYKHRNGVDYSGPITAETISEVQEAYKALAPQIANEDWDYGDFKAEMLLALEGVCVVSELGGKLAGIPVERLTNTEDFLSRYGAKWKEKNKEGELWRIEEVLRYADSI